ncbi:MAG: hypothetical protein ACPGU5_06780 [Lishizhenia sp.]
MVKFSCVLFTILLALTSYAQNFDLTLADEYKSKGSLIEIQSVNSEAFYTTRISRAFHRNNIYLEYYKNFELKASEKAPYKVNGTFGNFEELKIIGETPYCFLSDQTDKRKQLFALKLDTALNVLFESTPLLEDPVQRNRSTEESFRFIQSKNKNYLAVYINITLKGDVYDTYRFVVLDKKLNRIHSGDIQCVTPVEKTVLSNAYLSNKGIFYLGTKEYELDASRKLIKKYSLLSGLHLYRSVNREIAHQKIDLTTTVITETAIFELKNNQLVLSGMFRNINSAENNSIDGAFYAVIDFEKVNPVRLTFEYFSDSFITDGWSFKEKKSAFRKKEKGKSEPQLVNYKLRDFTYDSIKETFTGIAEQYYVEERSSADSRGYITTSYLYYYNALIVYQINNEGKFEWKSKIPKAQVSVNDYGYLSSITWLKNNEEMLLLYNDNKKNYSENGNYIEKDLSAATMSAKSNTLTLCTLNLQDGSFERNNLGTMTQNKNALLVPKLCEKASNDQELTIYLTGRKGGQFGRIKIY